MTSMTSPSDTIRLRSRLSAADLGLPGTTELTRSAGERSCRLADVPRRPQAPGWAGAESDRPAFVDDIEIIERSHDLGPAFDDIVGPSRRARLAVRSFDLLVAVAGLIVLAPLMLLVAIAVMVDSPGPIVYGSPRVGHDRPTFRAWKFRSMYTDAEADLDEILAGDGDARREYEVFHKLHDDPRLTRVGAVIRQTSLDELPQLVNILLGQMSVVGPRPKLAKDAESYGSALGTVLVVKPGLTGLWQVSGRNLLPMSERVVLDLEYIRSRTLIGDVRICARTFVQLWHPGRHGAH